MPHKITLSDAARETAEFYSSPAELERQARREIAAVLGRARFRTFNFRTMRPIFTSITPASRSP